MSVQFVLGRSGSGKTHFCLESIRAQLRDSAMGASLVFLVPEQATFQMEQDLLSKAGGIQGYHRVTITSFSRLAHLILGDTEPSPLKPLSSWGKQMILRRLLQEHAGELRVFHRSAERGGFIRQLGQMMTELQQCRKRPEDLAKQREAILGGGGGHEEAALADKLADLERLYRGYLQAVDGRFIDPDSVLDAASGCVGRSSFLDGAQVWIDGFSGFTLQQYHFLSAIAGRVSRVWVTLCLDAKSGSFVKLQNQPVDQPMTTPVEDLFHPTHKTFHRLRHLFGRVHPSVLSPEILPKWENEVMPRFTDEEVLGRLEQSLSGCDRQGGGREDSSDASFVSESQGEMAGVLGKGLMLVQASGARQEVQAAARAILELCRCHGYRFRDIAVILRDFGDYLDLVQTVFEDYGIGYFLDRRREIHHHPLVELIRSLLGVLQSRFKTETVLDYLKNDLIPLGRERIDSIENHVLAHGINGAGWYSGREWGGDLDSDRGQAMGPVLGMKEALYGAEFNEAQPCRASEITRQLVLALESLQARGRLSDWVRQARREGQTDEAQVHERLYSSVMDLLEDVVEILGEKELTLRDYSEILDCAFVQMTLPLVPAALDQVLVGTIERSRHPRIRAAFLLGVNERAFPKAIASDPFFTDSQRCVLEREGFELAETAAQKNFHERYLGYIALTRAREFLWVSYPLSNEQGKTTAASVFIQTIRRAVPESVLIHLGQDLPTAGLRSARSELKEIHAPFELTGQLAAAISGVSQGRAIDPVWLGLYEQVCQESKWKERLEAGLAGVFYKNQAGLDEDIVSEVYGTQLKGSVSQLETFAACPFRYFARYVMGLKPREELRFRALDLGSFYHEVLHRLFQRMRSEGTGWARMEAAEIDEMVQQVAQGYLEESEWFRQVREHSARTEFFLDNAVTRLKWFCGVLGKAARAGGFGQRFSELRFGTGGEQGPGALEISLSKSRRLRMEGIIDRVDLCELADRVGVLVIDYKSRSKRFSYGEFYHGLSLQLPSYLLALTELIQKEPGKAVEPAAALLFSIRPDTRSLSPSEGKDFSRCQRVHKAVGILNENWLSRLDGQVQPGKASAYYNFAIKKDGGISHPDQSGVVTDEQMKGLLEYGRGQLRKLAEGILDGDIQVSPYCLGTNQTPCRYCDYAGLCRFDPRCNPYRYLAEVSKKEVLSLIDPTS